MKFPSNRAGAYRARSVPVCALTHQSLAAQISGYAVHVAQPGRSAFKRRLDIGFESAPQTRPAARSSVSALDAGVTTPTQGAPTTMSGRSRPVSSGTETLSDKAVRGSGTLHDGSARGRFTAHEQCQPDQTLIADH